MQATTRNTCLTGLEYQLQTARRELCWWHTKAAPENRDIQEVINENKLTCISPRLKFIPLSMSTINSLKFSVLINVLGRIGHLTPVAGHWVLTYIHIMSLRGLSFIFFNSIHCHFILHTYLQRLYNLLQVVTMYIKL